MNSPARPDYSDARACIVQKSLEICEQCRLRIYATEIVVSAEGRVARIGR
jgi:hypothetical protein